MTPTKNSPSNEKEKKIIKDILKKFFGEFADKSNVDKILAKRMKNSFKDLESISFLDEEKITEIVFKRVLFNILEIFMERTEEAISLAYHKGYKEGKLI